MSALLLLTSALQASAAALEPTAITGRVSLAPALAAQVQPGDTLFVYARPVEGRMPLAQGAHIHLGPEGLEARPG